MHMRISFAVDLSNSQAKAFDRLASLSGYSGTPTQKIRKFFRDNGQNAYYRLEDDEEYQQEQKNRATIIPGDSRISE